MSPMVTYKNKENPVFCDVLLRPTSTEKTVRLQEHGIYTFVVARWADKHLVQKAIEFLFDVQVSQVSVLNQKGKSKIFRGRSGSRSDTRKAYVRLAPGQRIELAAGL